MARKPRKKILYDGCYGHIYSRALEHREIFQEAADFEAFKELLQQTKQRFNYPNERGQSLIVKKPDAVRQGRVSGI